MLGKRELCEQGQVGGPQSQECGDTRTFSSKEHHRAQAGDCLEPNRSEEQLNLVYLGEATLQAGKLLWCQLVAQLTQDRQS